LAIYIVTLQRRSYRKLLGLDTVKSSRCKSRLERYSTNVTIIKLRRKTQPINEDQIVFQVSDPTSSADSI